MSFSAIIWCILDLVVQPGQNVIISGDASDAVCQLKAGSSVVYQSVCTGATTQPACDGFSQTCEWGTSEAPRWGTGGFTVGEMGSLSLAYVVVDGELSAAHQLSMANCMLIGSGTIDLQGNVVAVFTGTDFGGRDVRSSGSVVVVGCSGELSSITVTGGNANISTSSGSIGGIMVTDATFTLDAASTTTLSGAISLNNAGQVSLHDKMFVSDLQLTLSGVTVLTLSHITRSDGVALVREAVYTADSVQPASELDLGCVNAQLTNADCGLASTGCVDGSCQCDVSATGELCENVCPTAATSLSEDALALLCFKAGADWAPFLHSATGWGCGCCAQSCGGLVEHKDVPGMCPFAATCWTGVKVRRDSDTDPRVTTLSIQIGSISSDGLASGQSVYDGLLTVVGDVGTLAALTELTELDLSQTGAYGSIAHFGALTHLTSLQLSGTAVTGDISVLASLQELTAISLYETAVTGDIASLSGMTQLTSLALRATGVSGHVGSLSALTQLGTLLLPLTVDGSGLCDVPGCCNRKMQQECATGLWGWGGSSACAAGMCGGCGGC